MIAVESTMRIASSKQETMISTQEENEKNVSFPELLDCSFSDIRSIPSLSELSDEEIERQWFGPEDFYQFKLTAKHIALEARRLSGFNRLLENSFALAGPFSADEDPLMRWSRYGHLQRGLEQWVSPKHSDERHEKKSVAIDAVLKAQDLLRTTRGDPEDTVRQLAEMSKKYTKDAALFAQRMGKADADVALPETRRDVTNHEHMRRTSPSHTLADYKHGGSDKSLGFVILPMIHRFPRKKTSQSNTAA
jgi:hypothetical protein